MKKFLLEKNGKGKTFQVLFSVIICLKQKVTIREGRHTLGKRNKAAEDNRIAQKAGRTHQRQSIGRTIWCDSSGHRKGYGMIKAGGLPLLATAKGYLLQKETDGLCRREIRVCHNREQIGDEMRLIVDLGGYILNTHVDHPIYGSVGESLRIKSRRDIQNFLTKTMGYITIPLPQKMNRHWMKSVRNCKMQDT